VFQQALIYKGPIKEGFRPRLLMDCHLIALFGTWSHPYLPQTLVQKIPAATRLFGGNPPGPCQSTSGNTPL